MSDSPALSANRARLNLETLEARENPTVHYFGGALLRHVEVQPVFYGSAWNSDPGTISHVESALQNLVTGPYMDALTRAGYGVGRGSSAGGVIDNISLTPGSIITDASIRARLTSDINNFTSLLTPDPERLYVIYVQKDVAISDGSGANSITNFLGYHTAFSSPYGTPIRYAIIAYPGGAVNNGSLGGLGIGTADQLTSVTSHEVAEAVTDPDVNYRRLGWYDPQRGEVADITANNLSGFVYLNGIYLVSEVATRRDRLLPVDLSSRPNSISTSATLSGVAVNHGVYTTVILRVRVQASVGHAAGDVRLTVNGRQSVTAHLVTIRGVTFARFIYNVYDNNDYDFSVTYYGFGFFSGSTSNTASL